MRSSSAHPPMRLAADAGYDSEANHVYLREQLGVESIIPPRHGRPSTKWRRLMKQQFDADAYGQRWQIETVFSMIKRRLGCVIRERRHHAQCRAMRLLALAHNCMILLRSMGSATEHSRPLILPTSAKTHASIARDKLLLRHTPTQQTLSIDPSPLRTHAGYHPPLRHGFLFQRSPAPYSSTHSAFDRSPRNRRCSHRRSDSDQ